VTALPITGGLSSRSRSAVRGVRDGLIAAGLLFAGYLFIVVAPQARTLGFDAYAYWRIDLADPYRLAAGSLGAFTYTPVIARLLAPASALSWPAFLWLWLALLVATVVWLGWRRSLWLLAFPPVAIELYHGNVHLLIAAAIALGFRYPAAWAFILLTKVTPGVGLLWFAVRREWRSLAIALGFTAALVGASIVFDLRLWQGWIERELLQSLREPANQPQLLIPLLVRLPIAAAIVTWGALTDRKWTVPLSAAIALPILWLAGFAILAAVPALTRPALLERRGGRPPWPRRGTVVGYRPADAPTQ
jgi:hypothetical protein